MSKRAVLGAHALRGRLNESKMRSIRNGLHPRAFRSGLCLVVLVRVTLSMHAGVAELNELLSRAANHARGALRSHEDLHRLLGNVARQLVPPVKAYVSVVLNGHTTGRRASTLLAGLLPRSWQRWTARSPQQPTPRTCSETQMLFIIFIHYYIFK